MSRKCAGESHPQDIPYPIDRKAVPFPVEIVMVGNRGKPGLCNECRQRHAQRDIHWDRHSILHDKNLDLETMGEIIQRSLQMVGQGEDSARDFWLSCRVSKYFIVDPLNVGIIKVSMRYKHTDCRIGVELTPIPVGDMPVVPEDLCPLCGFK